MRASVTIAYDVKGACVCALLCGNFFFVQKKVLCELAAFGEERVCVRKLAFERESLTHASTASCVDFLSA